MFTHILNSFGTPSTPTGVKSIIYCLTSYSLIASGWYSLLVTQSSTSHRMYSLIAGGVQTQYFVLYFNPEECKRISILFYKSTILETVFHVFQITWTDISVSAIDFSHIRCFILQLYAVSFDHVSTQWMDTDDRHYAVQYKCIYNDLNYLISLIVRITFKLYIA